MSATGEAAGGSDAGLALGGIWQGVPEGVASSLRRPKPKISTTP